MTQSTQVVRLDFWTIRQFLTWKQLGLYALVLLFVAITTRDSAVATGILMMYGLFYASYPFVIGEKTQMDLLYAALPLHRSELVRGRYLFVLLTDLVSAGIAFVFSLLLSFVFPLSLGTILGTILACLYLFSILSLLQLPVYFKLGYTKGKMIALLPLLLPTVLIVALFTLTKESKIADIASLLAGHPIAVGIGALLFWLLAAFVSLQLSQRFYAAREF